MVLCCSQLSCLKWSFSRYSRGMSCSSSLPLRCSLSKHFYTHKKRKKSFASLFNASLSFLPVSSREDTAVFHDNSIISKCDVIPMQWKQLVRTTGVLYLRWSSQVDDTIQLNVFAKLAVQPAVPVLVHGPLRLVQALTLIEVCSKDVPGSPTVDKDVFLASFFSSFF